MKLSSKVTFSDEKVKKAFLELSGSNEKKIYDWLVRAFKDIEIMLFVEYGFRKDLFLRNT